MRSKRFHFIIDEYRWNWAIRYLREAESDLSTAKKISQLSISVGFAIIAMKKMQTAIYFSLGDPNCTTLLIENLTSDEKDTLLHFLFKVNSLIQFLRIKRNIANKNEVLNNANQLMNITLKILREIIGKDLIDDR